MNANCHIRDRAVVPMWFLKENQPHGPDEAALEAIDFPNQSGAAGKNRTCDPTLTKGVLYP